MNPLTTNFYRPKYFKLAELAPSELIAKYGDMVWWFLDSRILWTADAIREYFNKPVTCNYQGEEMRGLRPPGYDVKNGVYMSPHEHGKALDLDVKDFTAEQVRQEIINHPSEPAFQYITRIEKAVDWLHIDCFNYQAGDRFFLF